MAVERKWNGTEWVVTGGGGDVAVGAVGMRATVEIDSAPSIGTSWTTVPTTRIEENHGGAFSLAANGVMTCLVAGVYSVSAGVFYNRTTDADLRVNLNLNGASIGKGLGSVSTNKYATLTMTATVSLDVGDEIWLSALANPATSLMSNINDYQGSYLEAFSVAGLKGDKGDTGDLAAVPSATLTRGTNQVITRGTGDQRIDFDAATVENGMVWNGTDQVTVPSDGLYQVSAVLALPWRSAQNITGGNGHFTVRIETPSGFPFHEAWGSVNGADESHLAGFFLPAQVLRLAAGDWLSVNIQPMFNAGHQIELRRATFTVVKVGN